jgi:hypothetical protein
VDVDSTWPWLICDCGQFAVWTRAWTDHGRGCELDADWSWTNCGCGKVVFMVMEKPWKVPAAAWTYSVDCPGRCQEIARLLRGCYAGCGADCDGNCQVTCEPSCELWCGHSAASDETFPANCRDTSRQFPGNCPHDSPDAARMLRRTLRGLRRQFRSHLPTIVPTLART